MKTRILIYAMAFAMTATLAIAVEDGLGTNHVRTLKVYTGIELGGESITTWEDVSGSTLTNNSISTSMIQDGAVTEDKLSTSVAGDGLTGGAGTPLAVGAAVNGGITVNADDIQVDGTVVRTTGTQTIGGAKTFTGPVAMPAPTNTTDAATKAYVDDKLSSSVADGAAASQTLRWDAGSGSWTNTAGLTVDASGNVAATGTLAVTGAATLSDNLGVTGNTTVGGTLGVTGDTTLGNVSATGTLGVTGDATLVNATASGNVTIQGNTTLGNEATDTITFTGKAASDLNMDNTRKVTGLAAPTADTDAVNKLYVDNAINGLSWKQSVRLATTNSIADLATLFNGETLDGLALATGDRILVKNQGAPAGNGIYVVKASGAPSRAADMTNTVQLAGAAVFVAEGASNARTAWVVTTPNATVGSGGIEFAQFASPGTYLAGDGLNLNGLTFSVNATNLIGNGLEVDSNNIRIAAAAAGTGLTGGGASDLAVNPGTGLEISGNTVQVDSTVIVDTGAQSIGGVKTFTSFPVTPSSDPADPYQVANKAYVDGKISSAVSDGAADNQTLRWDNSASAWTNSAGLTVDTSGNVAATGTLAVTGAATLSSTLGVTGNTTVGGTLGVTGAATLSDTLGVTGNTTVGGTLGVTGDSTLVNATATGNVTVEGNTVLGNASGDTITFTGTANSTLAMGDNKITGLAAPTANTDAAHKLYVDNAINGLSWKQAVVAASVADISVTTAPATIDGKALATGNRILLKNQDPASENGIYVFASANNPLTRATDMTNTTQLAGAAVFVAEGDTNDGTAWVCTAPTAALPGGGLITFAQFASPGTYTAGDGLNLNGLDFSVNATNLVGTGLEVDGTNNLRIAAAAAGDGLTGGGGSALTVDSTVVRTTGDQTLAGVKTFGSFPVTPSEAPTTDYQTANKKYVDDLLSSSVADGTVANDTLRWTGSAWTNTATLAVDASGNTDIDGTLGVGGAVTLASTLGVTGNTTVAGTLGVTNNTTLGGTLGVTGAVTVSDTTASTDKDTGALIVEGGVGVEGNINAGGNIDATGTLTVDGNTTLGDAIGTDTVTLNAKTTFAGATVYTPTATNEITAAVGITAAHIQNSYVRVRSNSGAVDLTATPQIAAGTAGQMLTLQGTDDTNTLKLDDGTGLSLDGGISFTLKNGHLIQFIFDGSVWRETFRTVPAP